MSEGPEERLAEPRSRGWSRLAGAALVGILAGFLSGLFGVGGGILIVPGLVLIMRMEQRRAHGTSLWAIVPIAVSGVGGYALERAIDWPAAALIFAGAAGGTVLGTHALQRLPQRGLRLGFGLFLLLAAGRLLVEVPDPSGRGELDLLTGAGLVALGVASGTLAGLLGVGGGIVIVPALVVLFTVPDAVAKGTSLAVIIPTGLVGTMRNLRHRNVELPLGAVIGLFGSGTAFAASKLAVGLDPRTSSILFAGLLVLVAAQMLIRPAAGPTERTGGGRRARDMPPPTEP